MTLALSPFRQQVAVMREEIEDIIREHAGDPEFILGFSDLYGIVGGELSGLIYGITVGLKLDDAILDEVEMQDGPTDEYATHYRNVNRRLDEITSAVADLLRSTGAKAEVIPATVDEPGGSEHPYYRMLSTSFPHKTAATRAGLGWVGKTALFVSDRFGPRVRLATVLTDYSLETGTPCEMSLCGDCQVCVEACPAGAATGTEWFPGLEREEFFDAFRCRAQCREFSGSRLERAATICGICVAVCPVGMEFRTPAEADEWY